MQTQIDQCRALFAYQLFYLGVVVAFVLTAQDEHRLGGHALQSVPTGVDVGSLRVVDEVHTSYVAHALQSVFHPLEVTQRLADILLFDTGYVG